MTDYDVVIVGGGVAGLSAGVFTARADLDTLVVNDGVSILYRNAILENFPGFPAGVDSRLFSLMLEEQAERAGCARLDAKVAEVSHADDGGFTVETKDGEAISGDRVVAASWSNSSYLEGLDLDFEQSGSKQYVSVDETGRTDVEGLYAAGRLAEQYHQAIVASGHGSQVGLTLIEDANPDFYHDWVAPEGYFTNRDREVPEGCEEISEDERQRRARQAHDRLRKYVEEWEDERPVPHPSFVEKMG
ncbi:MULTISPECIES: FAD-dependent oxidoreductase [unclassified Haladaptatus]|uniref:FAD-dependent oxidoreductase n=1 Tax=unclassified Haladaptatus TaxID=2622732 RepID=UPI00209BE9B7|nr:MULTISPECIES: FAD-dependent oxidoreductase [unclassified Haladaptatus]MCO8245101.1 NAD(P)/FAD-dependent oxidoreductase [Haladaptatus sp. AB643]MCO8253244.1 NAD(P)/FAD-dependent oxidoreductase [Haladaptatus sp. AB618]